MTILGTNPFAIDSYNHSVVLQTIMNAPMPQLSAMSGNGSGYFMPTIPTLFMPAIPSATAYSKGGQRFASNQYSGKAGDLLSIARSYIGYNENDGSYLKFTNGRREAWCADFVSYCARQAGINGPNTSSVEGIRQWGKANGKYSTTQAKVGDAVIFKNGTSHTGLIESISNGQITCIEGNTSDKVARRTYSINDPKISGFVSLA